MRKPLNQTRGFWLLLMTGAVGLYLLGLALAIFSKTPMIGIILLAAILFLHVLELKTALRVGRAKGMNDRSILLMNMIFGFTWWVPLKNDVI